MEAIGSYKIKEYIQTDHNPRVYRGIQGDQSDSVVLKVLNDYPENHLPAIRLRHDYEVRKSLDIDGMVKAHSLEKWENHLVLVMEDFGGYSLKSHLHQHLPDLETLLSIAIKITECVVQMHKKDVIHKDLKPSNIIFNGITGELKLNDFELAHSPEIEQDHLENTDIIHGTLTYLSPEQSGRIERKVDHRTDLYSLGILFYEMFTGNVPFADKDPLKLVHSHLAKVPVAPHERNRMIPKPLSEMILKLMAKSPEDRYQSAIGLKHDLEECEVRLLNEGHLDGFQLGRKDKIEPTHFPSTFYGRETEIETILTIWEASRKGSVETLFISGLSGVGKSALVQEAAKKFDGGSGAVLYGKFDQPSQEIAYSAIGQAFRGIVQELLVKSETELNIWRKKLAQAWGPNGKVVIDILPELELIVGEQPELVDLDPLESQNRHAYVLQKFFDLFASPEHPLVLFLDDLQWADSASLTLLDVLLRDHDLKYFLLIGTFRSDETENQPQLAQLLQSLRSHHRSLHELTLMPLPIDNLKSMIHDVMGSSPEKSEFLSKVLQRKAGGNLFFTKKLLETLYHDEELFFSEGQGRWTWKEHVMRDLEVSDNVLDLLVGLLVKLPAPTLETLKFAACIGNQFSLETLALVSSYKETELPGYLSTAVQDEILQIKETYSIPNPNEEGGFFSGIGLIYKFQHGRLQQAVYSLIGGEQRKATHLKIGRLLFSTETDDEVQKHLFDIVGHLNAGADLINDPAEQVLLQELNRKAGKKAFSSTAYRAALHYYSKAIQYLPEDSWDDDFDTTFSLFEDCAESAYLCGDFDIAEQNSRILFEKSRTPLQKAEILKMQTIQYITMGKNDEAIQTSIWGLKLLGIQIPVKVSRLMILKEIGLAKWNLGKRKIESLIDQPSLQDEQTQLCIKLLMEITPPALITGNERLFLYVVLKLANLSLRHGNCHETAFAYVIYGVLLGSVVGDQTDGFQFGKLAVELNKKFHDVKLKCKVLFVYSVFIHVWNESWHSVDGYLQEAIEAGKQGGDLMYLSYCLHHLSLWNPQLNQKSIARQKESHLVSIEDTQYANIWNLTKFRMQFIYELRGQVSPASSLHGNEFDEEECLQEMERSQFVFGKAVHYLSRLQITYFRDDWELQEEWYAKLQPVRKALTGQLYALEASFFSFLFVNKKMMRRGQTRHLWKLLKKEYKQVCKWASHCPQNFLQYQLIMEAEMAHLQEKRLKAIDLYAKAIEVAHNSGSLREEAIANELASRFYLAHGNKKFGIFHVKEAVALFSQWGAEVKVRQISGQHEQIVNYQAPLMKESMSTTNTSLDLTSVIKASQSISGEINLENLLSNLVEILVHNSGAEKGVLSLLSDNKLRIEAVMDVASNHLSVLQSIPLESNQLVPETIIRYVIRTKSNVLLDDPTREGLFIEDPYIKSNHPQSILCLPIRHQNQMVGVLYLENNQVKGAFSKDRMQLLHLLTAQAAISIENARLYDHLENKIATETAAKKKLKQLNTIGGKLAKVFDRMQVMDLVYTALRGEADITRCTLYLNNNETLVLFCTLPEMSHKPLHPVVKMGEGPIGVAAKTHNVISIRNNPKANSFSGDAGMLSDEVLLCIPLLDGPLLLGVMKIDANVSHLAENSQERTVAEALCGLLSISLKNIQLMEDTRQAIRMEEELKTTAAVQKSLFPTELPVIQNLELAGYYQSALETGGDWYGVMAEYGDALYILIGDVTGHGTPSALVTASASATCHTLIQMGYDQGHLPTPLEILNYLNQTVADVGAPNYLMTFFAACLDRSTGKMNYADAGHNYPVLIRNGKEKRLLTPGPRLGDNFDMECTEKSIQLEKGDLLFFFTDGLIEAENLEGKIWGERKLIRLLKKSAHLPAQTIVKQVTEQMEAYCGDQPLDDDVTFVCCRVTEDFPNAANF